MLLLIKVNNIKLTNMKVFINPSMNSTTEIDWTIHVISWIRVGKWVKKYKLFRKLIPILSIGNWLNLYEQYFHSIIGNSPNRVNWVNYWIKEK